MLDDPLVKPFLTNVVEDESNLPIIECLIDGVETDEEIAEKTGIRLNLVRKILYKLYDLKLASYKRSMYDIPVIAVTGSVGKTSTKDIIANVLSQKYNVLKIHTCILNIMELCRQITSIII